MCLQASDVHVVRASKLAVERGMDGQLENHTPCDGTRSSTRIACTCSTPRQSGLYGSVRFRPHRCARSLGELLSHEAIVSQNTKILFRRTRKYCFAHEAIVRRTRSHCFAEHEDIIS